MCNEKICTEKKWPSGELSIKRMGVLQQIEKDADAETPSNVTNEANKHVCEYCGTKELVFQFPCKRCGMILCLRHRVPETHDCVSVTWKITDKYVKHFLNDYEITKPNTQEGKKA